MIADYALGISLLKREDESLRDYAMSFSPLAPFFGVPYRFSALLKGMPAMTAPGAGPAPAPLAPMPALDAPKAAEPAAAKAAKKAKKAKAKAEDLFEAEIDVAASAAKVMAASTTPAFPDDMAEAAPGLEEALDPAPEPEAEPEEAAETVAETAVEAAEDAVEIVTEAPALLYDSAPDLSDDLKRIKGVGPKLESELNGMGVYTFAQVASMTEANLAWIDGNLSTFKGRSLRDDWIGQATTLLAS